MKYYTAEPDPGGFGAQDPLFSSLSKKSWRKKEKKKKKEKVQKKEIEIMRNNGWK